MSLSVERWNAGRLRIGVIYGISGPSPRKTTTNRCSLTGSTKISTPGILAERIFWTMAVQRSVVGRPARRSVIFPAASKVQKLLPDRHVL